ncbi:MAG: sulfotransferase [Pseudomonadota bacterium]
MDKDLAFVVSGGRTGTTFFGNNLSRFIPDAFSVHEPDVVTQKSRRLLMKRIGDFGLWHMILGRALGQTGIRLLAEKRLTGTGDHDALVAAIHAHRDRYFSRLDKPLIVESYSQWFGVLPQLRAAYPNAKIVAIVRDPRDWVVSWLNHGGRHTRGDFVTAFVHRRLTPDLVGDTAWAGQWDEMDAFAKLCWDWKLINTALADFAKTDTQTRLYKFEDLFGTEDDSQIRDLIDFVADHGARRYPARFDRALWGQKVNARGDKVARWQAWSPGQAATLKAHCGPLMEQFGYGQEAPWSDLLAA